MKLTDSAKQDVLMLGFSGLADGSMSKGVDDEERRRNRERFLKEQGISLKQSILVHLQYEGNDYCRYYTVGSPQAGDGMVTSPSLVADALFTRDHKLALFLPVADCIGAVLYDPKNQVIGLAHLGRHNLVQTGAGKVITYMQQEFGTNPAAVRIWFSPAAGRESYPLYDFNNRSLQEVALQQMLDAGVMNDNLEIDGRDTATDLTLFSHSQFLKGNRPSDGRQAVVVMMK
ncbi:Protein of hypothetical function DUF152 [Candidatus Saccharibacteria bacterium RAAC3_TM7_1]|nr:Protein of hypothetical function DUF152 [Candidatus Saccharibacteria bacterium RAAC3_TM7_1]HCZ28348.1 hypothetical protein [Candidatus Saccharibacteria bacterium]